MFTRLAHLLRQALLSRTGIIVLGIVNTVLVSVLFVLSYSRISTWFVQRSFERLTTEQKLVHTTFTTLTIEHVNLEFISITSLFSPNTFATSVHTQLLEHSRQLAGYFGEVYGPEREAELFALLKAYDEALRDYARSTTNGDMEARAAALSVLSGHPKKMAQYYVKLKPDLSEQMIQYAVTEYVARIKTSADAYASNNFQEALVQRKQALKYAQDTAILLDRHLFDSEPKDE